MNRKPTRQPSLILTRSLLAGAVALSLAFGGMGIASAQPTGMDHPRAERGAPWGGKDRADFRRDMSQEERQALRERKQERRAAWEAMNPEERREMREKLRDMDPQERREWFQQKRG
ncbi:hypothetical protein LRB11_03620 [Ectothiorhodospira haloalkaliphila]|uniref:hypothetical protein n=1 Tax=Ectothiorhodospira haloalkaliphila TaxID=421628 RepID=UPI001EE83FE0|nr:hypothetical protein [Ectothiorhodospira haloalkaliphila]MCG5524020.1 hypothetical protein [Ectothiorhodospira haloalkaliphila]